MTLFTVRLFRIARFLVNSTDPKWDSGQPNDKTDPENDEQNYACLRADGLADYSHGESNCEPLCQFPFGLSSSVVD